MRISGETAHDISMVTENKNKNHFGIMRGIEVGERMVIE